MKIRRKWIAVLAAMMLVMPQQTVWAEDATDTPAAVEADAQTTTVKPTAATTTAAAVNQTVSSANPSVVGVISGYQFSDGTVDVWYTASGAAVTDTAIATSAASVAYMDQTAVSTTMNAKKASYTRLGIDLSDYETFKKSMVTYICKADGTYAKVNVLYYDASTKIALLDSTGLNLKLLSSAASYKGDAFLCGYSMSSLTTEGSAVKTQAKASALTQIKYSYAGFSGKSAASPTTAPDMGFVGGAILTPDGKLCGLITAISGQTVSAAGYDQIQQTVSAASGTASKTSGQDAALSDLKDAIQKAEELDMSEYTAESASGFNKALTNAKNVILDGSSTTNDIASATDSLNSAMDSLTKQPEGRINKRKLLALGVLVLLMLAAAVVLILFVIRKANQKAGVEPKPEKKEKQKKDRKDRKKPSSEEEPSGAYGGELARQSTAMKNSTGTVDDGEAETTLLDDGEAETTLLKEPVKAYLTDEYGNRTDITCAEFIIGKERRKVSYCISDSTVSRQHCIIRQKEEGYTLEDMGSLNGTTVNGVKAEKGVPVDLKDGDILQLSDVTLVFHMGD